LEGIVLETSKRAAHARVAKWQTQRTQNSDGRGLLMSLTAWAIPLSFLPESVIGHSFLFVAFCCSSRQFVGLFNTYLTLPTKEKRVAIRFDLLERKRAARLIAR
jgi:hypothetical protein